MVYRHLPEEASSWDYDKWYLLLIFNEMYLTIYQHQSIDRLSKVTHVRLDRENISLIDNMELFGNNVTNLYLQHVNILIVFVLNYTANYV